MSESFCSAVKRELTHWDPRTFSTVGAAVASLDGILEKIIVKYVKKTMPQTTSVAEAHHEDVGDTDV